MTSRPTPATIPQLVRRAERAVEVGGEKTRYVAAAQVADTVGCILAGSTHPTVDRLVRYATAVGSAGDRRSIARPDRPLDLPTALVLDATASHVDEYDSVHPRSGTVPSGIVVPSALAVGRRLHRSGAQVLDAVIAGYEVMVEAALRRGGSSLYRRSWWPSLVFGPLGAAMAAARLLELDRDRTGQALALAAGSAGGLLTADVFEDGHYWHFGEVAARGVRAAFAAQAGMTASPTLLDRPSDLAFGPRAAPSEEDRTPHLLDCVYKTYPCAMPLQPVAQALSAIRADLGPATATEVHVGIPEALLTFVTADTDVSGPPEAASSAAYVVGAALAGDPADLQVYRRHDPADASGVRVTIAADERASSPTGGLTAVVRIVTADGDVREVVHAFEPSREVSRSKDAANRAFVERSEPSIETLLNLDAVPDVGTLFTSPDC